MDWFNTESVPLANYPETVGRKARKLRRINATHDRLPKKGKLYESKGRKTRELRSEISC